MRNIDIAQYPVEDLARGTTKTGSGWECLVCGEHFEDGVIHEAAGKYLEAWKAALEHRKAAHGPMFRSLMQTQQRLLGLTQHQATVLELMAAGLNDKEIAGRISGTENTSSIRNLRFHLREREKQAKAYLALMEAFRAERAANPNQADAACAVPQMGASLADERFAVTERERAAVLKTYFTAEGVMKEFPVREKRKIIALQAVAARFQPGRAYTEKEVNETIAYPDFATVRRYLIEYGFLERSQDCREYRVKERSHGSA